MYLYKIRDSSLLVSLQGNYANVTGAYFNYFCLEALVDS